MARRNDRDLHGRRRRPAADARGTGRRMRHAERMRAGRSQPDVRVHRRDAPPRRGRRERTRAAQCLHRRRSGVRRRRKGRRRLPRVDRAVHRLPRFTLPAMRASCGRRARRGDVRDAGGGRPGTRADGGVRGRRCYGLVRPMHRCPRRRRAAAATAERKSRHRQGRCRPVGDGGRRGEGRGSRRPALRTRPKLKRPTRKWELAELRSAMPTSSPS